MCGIVGYVNFTGEPVDPLCVKLMTDALAHRGPDGEGQWVEENVGLGHRRLSIIDLSENGKQPMRSLSGRYVLTYNGEIFNFRELRRELESSGIRFQTATDTEVLLASIEFWGMKAIQKFNGMFAFALWDRKLKKLFLARDRYGIKPLYYSIQENVLRFGSEQKAILVDRNFKKHINSPALLEYFTFQNFFSDSTLINAIKILRPGYYLEINLQQKKYQIIETQYWDFDFKEPDRKYDRREYIEELQRLFEQAVNRQMVSDVEVGTYLSGGMDSGSITAIASRRYRGLKTFTCGFDLHAVSQSELTFDERAKSEMLSRVYATEHYEMVLKPSDMERSLSLMAQHLEEPRVGQSYPNYYVSRLASKFVKVVLSGAGGDELFGGYPWRYYRAVNCENFGDYADKYYKFWQRLIPNREIHKVFSPIWKEVSHIKTFELFKDVFKTKHFDLNRPEDLINNSLYFEAKTFLHGLLVVEDKLSMAHGLETRVPFLDNDLVDFAQTCPVSLKLNNLKNVLRIDENLAGKKQYSYFQKSNDGKQILREAMRSILPNEITNLEKQGFSAPDASWYRDQSSSFVKTFMHDENPIYQYLDQTSLNGLINEHLDNYKNRRLLVWSFLNVSKYLEHLG